MLINPGTVGAKFEVGAADTNLVSGILRGATPAEMGVPSGMRLVITPMVRLELLNHGAVTPEALDVALNRTNIEVREIAQDLKVAALKEITPLYSKGQLSNDFAKAINQIADLHILAEAKAAGLPLLTNNINDFNVSAIGGLGAVRDAKICLFKLLWMSRGSTRFLMDSCGRAETWILGRTCSQPLFSAFFFSQSIGLRGFR